MAGKIGRTEAKPAEVKTFEPPKAPPPISRPTPPSFQPPVAKTEIKIEPPAASTTTVTVPSFDSSQDKPADKAPISSVETSVKPAPPAVPATNYDVKPTVNPTWVGEEAKPTPPPSSTADSEIQKSPSPTDGFSPNTTRPNPTVPPSATPPATTKPNVNPWPILPPRSMATNTQNTSSTNMPPRPAVPATPPQAPPIPTATDQKPAVTSNNPGLTPTVPSFDSSQDKPQIKIPTSYQTQPVPISTPTVTPPAPSTPSPMPNLPPPPATNNVAPFSQGSSTPVTTPKPAETNIQFDQAPKTILDPGEAPPDKPETPPAATDPMAPTPPAPTATPPQGQSSVQDLEI